MLARSRGSAPLSAAATCAHGGGALANISAFAPACALLARITKC
jgi:hypothetical protein